MSKRAQIGKWLAALGICGALALPGFAQRPNTNSQQNRPPQDRREQKQQRQQQQAEHQQRQQQKQQRQQMNQAGRETQRNANRPPQTNVERNDPPRGNGNPNRPPSANMPPGRATPQERQRNEQQFSRLSPQQKQELVDRVDVWRKLTPQQRDHIKNDVLPKWQQLPPDRQRAIRSRLKVLKNMPESARNQHLNDPNFTRGMSEEDKATLHDLSHLHVGGAPEPPNE